MSKKSKELENAILDIVKVGDYLPEIIPQWMEALGIKPNSLIIGAEKIGDKSPTNKTDILIIFQESPPLKISAKLSNADYFGNWYSHKRLIEEFGEVLFDKLTIQTTLWANKWAKNPNASLFVGVSVSFGYRSGNTCMPFLDVFETSKDLKKIICGIGDLDNAANCLYVSSQHPKSIGDLVLKLLPIDIENVEKLSRDIKVIFRPVNPLTEDSNRGKNVYTRFQPNQRMSKITDITTINDLIKIGEFVPVTPTRVNHNHILSELLKDYNIQILFKKREIAG
jgi:hypothetical protein